MAKVTATIRGILANDMSEEHLQSNVDGALRKVGAEYVYHTHNSRFSEGSFPDTFAILCGRIILIENKAEKGKFLPAKTTKKGRYIPGQLDVLELLLLTGKVEVYTMRPSDWLSGKMERIIAGTEPMANIKELKE